MAPTAQRLGDYTIERHAFYVKPKRRTKEQLNLSIPTQWPTNTRRLYTPFTHTLFRSPHNLYNTNRYFYLYSRIIPYTVIVIFLQIFYTLFLYFLSIDILSLTFSTIGCIFNIRKVVFFVNKVMSLLLIDLLLDSIQLIITRITY